MSSQTNTSTRYVKKLFTDYSYWLSFFAILLLALAVSPNLFSWYNATNIFIQSAHTGIIALGMTMVICTGMIDISVGAQLAIISGLSIEVLNATGNIFVMLLFCLALGLVIGTINGLLVSKGKMPPMVATLAVQIICRSIINHIGQGGPFTIPASSPVYKPFSQVASGSFSLFGLKIPYLMVMFIVFAMIASIIMKRTKLGKHIYAVGSNETAAKLAGVNVSFIKVIVFSITGLLCGFSSWIYASRVMAVSAASAGNLVEMDAIAAVAIGGTSMNGGRGKIIGTFLGVLMFKIINFILLAANVPTFLNNAISGAIIIVAVLIQSLRKEG